MQVNYWGNIPERNQREKGKQHRRSEVSVRAKSHRNGYNLHLRVESAHVPWVGLPHPPVTGKKPPWRDIILRLLQPSGLQEKQLQQAEGSPLQKHHRSRLGK